MTALGFIYAAGAFYHFSMMMNRIRISGAPDGWRVVVWVLTILLWPLAQLILWVEANKEQWQ